MQQAASPVIERWRERLRGLRPDEFSSRPAAVTQWVRRGWLLMALLLAAGLVVTLNREVTQGVSDFRGFHEASHYLMQRGERLSDTTFAYYLPSLEVACIGLAWLPLSVAGTIWYLLGCWSWIALLRSVDHYLLEDCQSPLRRIVILLAGLLVTPLALDGLCLGSFQTFMVWWMVAGLGRISRGKSVSGGILLGLAIWIKVLPLIAVGYLVLKRRWKAALVAIVCAVAVDGTLSVVGYGPAKAWAEHQQWWEEQAQGACSRQLADPNPIGEDRLTNQSLVVILRRTLSSMGIDHGEARAYTTVLHLSSPQVTLVYIAALGLLGVGIVVYCGRPGEQLSSARWTTEIALVTLATLWVSPVLWSYHPTAVLPALAVVLARTAMRPRLGWGIILGWLLAMGLLGCPLACALGEIFWATLALGGLLVWTGQLGMEKLIRDGNCV
jgi:alpha-1,2-mannosyltransferase